MLATRGGPGAGRGVGLRPPTRSTIAAMCSGRGAAAASHEADTVALDELGQHLRELLGGLREDRLAVGPLDRQAGVRDAVDRQRRVLAEVADRVPHVLGTGRAVEPDDVHPHALEDREDGLDVGAEEHLAAVREQRYGNLDRHRATDPLEGPASADDRGAHLEDVLRGFDDHEVDATVDEGAGLLVEDLGELLEADVAERRIVARRQEAGRADRPGDEAIRPGGLTGDLGGTAVDLDRVVGQPPFVELQPRTLEAVGLEHLGAGFEEGLVNAGDDVGAMQDERLVALPLEPAVVLAGQVESLQRRAHTAVEDDDPLVRGGEDVAFRFAHREVSSIVPGCRTVLRRSFKGSTGCGGFDGPGPSAALDGVGQE